MNVTVTRGGFGATNKAKVEYEVHAPTCGHLGKLRRQMAEFVFVDEPFESLTEIADELSYDFEINVGEFHVSDCASALPNGW